MGFMCLLVFLQHAMFGIDLHRQPHSNTGQTSPQNINRRTTTQFVLCSYSYTYTNKTNTFQRKRTSDQIPSCNVNVFNKIQPN